MNADPALKALIIFVIVSLLIIAACGLKDFKNNPRFYIFTSCIFLAIAYFLCMGLSHQCANEVVFRWC